MPPKNRPEVRPPPVPTKDNGKPPADKSRADKYRIGGSNNQKSQK